MIVMTTGVGGSGVRPLLVGGFVAAGIAACWMLSSAVMRTPVATEDVYSRNRFRWFWVPAGLLAVFQFLFMGGQLVSDPKIENVFALAVISAFSALIVLGMFKAPRIRGNWMIAVGVLPMLPFFWIVVPTVLSLIVIVGALADNIAVSSKRPAIT